MHRESKQCQKMVRDRPTSQKPPFPKEATPASKRKLARTQKRKTRRGNGELLGDKSKDPSGSQRVSGTFCLALEMQHLASFVSQRTCVMNRDTTGFAVIETSRGIDVTGAGRAVEAAQKHRTRKSELQKAIDYRKYRTSSSRRS